MNAKTFYPEKGYFNSGRAEQWNKPMSAQRKRILRRHKKRYRRIIDIHTGYSPFEDSQEYHESIA